jgi:hypothetical protein
MDRMVRPVRPVRPVHFPLNAALLGLLEKQIGDNLDKGAPGPELLLALGDLDDPRIADGDGCDRFDFGHETSERESYAALTPEQRADGTALSGPQPGIGRKIAGVREKSRIKSGDFQSSIISTR